MSFLQWRGINLVVTSLLKDSNENIDEQYIPYPPSSPTPHTLFVSEELFEKIKDHFKESPDENS